MRGELSVVLHLNLFRPISNKARVIAERSFLRISWASTLLHRACGMTRLAMLRPTSSFVRSDSPTSSLWGYTADHATADVTMERNADPSTIGLKVVDPPEQMYSVQIQSHIGSPLSIIKSVISCHPETRRHFSMRCFADTRGSHLKQSVEVYFPYEVDFLFLFLVRPTEDSYSSFSCWCCRSDNTAFWP